MTRKLLRYALRSVWLLALLAAGALVMLSSYQAFASWRATSKWHPPGQLVDLGAGRRLHFQCDGEGDGLVVLVAGGGGFGWFWGNVRKEAARAVGTRVCSYDHPGAGWSDALTGSYSVATEAETLLSGLDTLGAKQPVVLVGHSYGAFVAQAFTAQCRARVRALLSPPARATVSEAVPQ